MRLNRHTWLALVLAVSTSALGTAHAQSQSKPRVQVETNLGSFVIELEPERAPLTVENFLQYVDEGHYTGTLFHRVVHGFIAQGGGFTEDYEEKVTERTVPNEAGNGLSNLRGTVGMARTSEPHSAAAQFYVNLADNFDLNPRATRWGYAVFGTVIEGMGVVDEIGHKPTAGGGQFTRDVPVEPIVIQSVTRLD